MLPRSRDFWTLSSPKKASAESCRTFPNVVSTSSVMSSSLSGLFMDSRLTQWRYHMVKPNDKPSLQATMTGANFTSSQSQRHIQYTKNLLGMFAIIASYPIIIIHHPMTIQEVSHIMPLHQWVSMEHVFKNTIKDQGTYSGTSETQSHNP